MGATTLERPFKATHTKVMPLAVHYRRGRQWKIIEARNKGEKRIKTKPRVFNGIWKLERIDNVINAYKKAKASRTEAAVLERRKKNSAGAIAWFCALIADECLIAEKENPNIEKWDQYYLRALRLSFGKMPNDLKDEIYHQMPEVHDMIERRKRTKQVGDERRA